MSDAKAILSRARSMGLSLAVEGDLIAIAPARLCPPDLLAEFREHKPALLILLEGQTSGLSPDKAAWLPTARQILAGEFDGCDRSMRESLTIGLRSIQHLDCQRALERLTPNNPLGT
jgi:hypothetical protein